MREDELIERLEMFREDARLIMTRDEVQQHIDLLSRLKAENEKLRAVLKNTSTPRHETVEQWEARTGESYPDDGAVWTFSPYEQEWQLYTLKELEHTICESMYVANHHGKPEIEG